MNKKEGIGDNGTMDFVPFVIAKATLLFLAVVLVIEYAIRRREVSRDLLKNLRKEQQLATYSAELKTLREKIARKSEIADQFPRITKKMTEKFPSESYPAIAVRSAKEFFRAGKVGYFAQAEDSSDYTLVVGAGFPPEWVGNVRIHSDEGILGMALQKRMVVSKMDLLSSSGRRPSRPSLEGMDVAPDFVAPIFGFSDIVGALVVTGCSFPLEEERINMSMLADLLSMALQNATLLDPTRDGNWVDPLTGVSNRIYFLQRFENEIRRTENYRQTLALFMLDIDEFKKVNDTHGHYAGDIVIKRVADIVRKNTRGYDLVGRYGGDEFMVLFTSTTEGQAISSVEHLRVKISTADISIPGTGVPVRITISGGLALFPTHGQSTTDLFRAADEALFESKRQGRNRIQVAKSVGLDGGIAKGTGADQETPISTDHSADAGSDAVGYPLGKLGEDLNS
jgi:diguanylate cyclase (GGDEF)-like protein